jgi:hypothetical protein
MKLWLGWGEGLINILFPEFKGRGKRRKLRVGGRRLSEGGRGAPSGGRAAAAGEEVGAGRDWYVRHSIKSH